MYVVMNRVMVNKAWHEEFVERFAKRKGQIEKEPGFIAMQVLKPEAAETPFVVYTRWQNKASFELWIKSDDFKIAHRNPMPKEAFSTGGGLETFDVVVIND